MKYTAISKAIEMRQNGFSVKDICISLGVSKGSVCRWTKGIKLTKEVAEKVENRKNVQRKIAGDSNRKYWREKRKLYQEQGKNLANQCIKEHIIGCMLYWAEGRKSRNSVGFTNSDPDMVKTFVDFLRNCYNVEPSKILVNINVYTNNGIQIREIEEWWLNKLMLPATSLRKSTEEKPRANRGKKTGKHIYGICTILLHDVKVLQSIYGAIQEYCSFINNDLLG